MREERPRSQIISTHDSRVRAIQSTQLDLEQLEQELVTPGNDANEIGNGDIPRDKEPARRTLKQLRSLLEYGGSATREHLKNSKRPCAKSDTASSYHYVSNIDTCCNETKLEFCHNFQSIDDEGHIRPIICDSIGRLSDDTNENAIDITGAEKASNRFLNQDNSAVGGSRRPKSRASRRKVRSRSRCESPKQKRPKSRAGHRVIALPPNSVLKITSTSALNVHKGQREDGVVKRKTQSPSLSKTAKRFESCPEDQKSAKNAKLKPGSLKQAAGPSSLRANKSNSSRYRVTPCPASASSASSLWSHQSFASSRPPGLISPGTMKYRSSSGKLAATRSRSLSRYKRTGSKRSRQSSASGSAFSWLTSSRRRRSRHHSASFHRRASNDNLLGEQNVTGSNASLHRSSRNRSAASLSGGRRRRRASSPRRRKSRGSVRRASSRRSSRRSSQARMKRGRPRGSGKKSRSSSVSEVGHKTGFFDKVSSLWRSYSFSRSATPVQSPSSDSWVSKMLPLPRSKHEKRLQRHRDRAYKYSRARDESEETNRRLAEARRKRKQIAGDSAKGVKKERGGSVICSIM